MGCSENILAPHKVSGQGDSNETAETLWGKVTQELINSISLIFFKNRHQNNVQQHRSAGLCSSPGMTLRCPGETTSSTETNSRRPSKCVFPSARPIANRGDLSSDELWTRFTHIFGSIAVSQPQFTPPRTSPAHHKLEAREGVDEMHGVLKDEVVPRPPESRVGGLLQHEGEVAPRGPAVVVTVARVGQPRAFLPAGSDLHL